jgi:hypothetical protein
MLRVAKNLVLSLLKHLILQSNNKKKWQQKPQKTNHKLLALTSAQTKEQL